MLNGPPVQLPGAPLTVRGQWINLRPVTEADYPLLYSWRVDAAFVALWQTAGRRIPTYREYLPELERFLTDGITLLVSDQETGEIGGFVRAYNINPVDGWAWVQAYLTPELRMRPYKVGEAAALFANYMFSMLPLRKLCSEVFEYNTISIRLSERLRFRECGRLPDHVWYDGQLWSSVLYTLTREDWGELRDQFRFLLGVEHDVATATHGP